MESLENLPEFPESLRVYYLAEFRSYLHDYIDTIPPQTLKPDDENYYKYKCRGNYFNDLCLLLNSFTQSGYYISFDLREEIREFSGYYQDLRKSLIKLNKVREQFTGNDIGRANEILKLVIEELRIH